MSSDAMSLMDYDLFADPVPVENGVYPLVTCLRSLGCLVLSSCEGHSPHESGVLFAVEPHVLFLPPAGMAQIFCSLPSQGFWSQLEWNWMVSVCEHEVHGFVFRISPARFDLELDRHLRQSPAVQALSLVSRKHALKHYWPTIRASINMDVETICRMLPVQGELSCAS